MKDIILTSEQESQLFMQLDEYAMADIGFKEDSSFNDIIEEYKEEFQQSEYNNYYDFIMDKLEEEFNNQLHK